MLPVVETLDPGFFVNLLLGRGVAESVNVSELFKEKCGIVHAVKTELQRLNIAGVKMNRGLLAGHEGAVGADREVGFGGMGQRGKQAEREQHQYTQNG